MGHFDILPFPPGREIVVDAGYLGSRRHITYGLVEVDITKSKLDKTGMVMDFKHAKKILFDVLEGLDHKYINELPYFKTHNPTSENISKFIFDRLDKKIDGLSKVSVWETGTSCASYER